MRCFFALQNVVFFDGHTSHANNIELIRLVLEYETLSGNAVRVVCFPSGQTSRLQPLDVSVFGGLKKNWSDYLRDMHVDADVEVADWLSCK